MQSETYYTTQLQAGLGMIQETLDLLHLWSPGTIPSQLAEQAVTSGIFSRATARRTRNLVAEMFAPRYLSEGGKVASRLKYLQEHKISYDALSQIFYIQTARSQSVFNDFVAEVYWPKYMAGATIVTKDDAERFIHQALDSGKMRIRWSDSTIKRVSGYVLGCCTDFGLLSESGRNERTIKRFSIRNDTALYLAYDLHCSGLSDMAVALHEDWRLFGLDMQEVIRLLKTISYDGHLLIQSSADLLQISWTYKTMEDCLYALTKR